MNAVSVKWTMNYKGSKRVNSVYLLFGLKLAILCPTQLWNPFPVEGCCFSCLTKRWKTRTLRNSFLEAGKLTLLPTSMSRLCYRQAVTFQRWCTYIIYFRKFSE